MVIISNSLLSVGDKSFNECSSCVPIHYRNRSVHLVYDHFKRRLQYQSCLSMFTLRWMLRRWRGISNAVKNIKLLQLWFQQNQQATSYRPQVLVAPPAAYATESMGRTNASFQPDSSISQVPADPRSVQELEDPDKGLPPSYNEIWKRRHWLL